MDIKPLDLEKDDLMLYLDNIEDKCFIHNIDEEHFVRVLLNFMGNGWEGYDYVKINRHLPWDELKNSFYNKYQPYDGRQKNLQAIMKFCWNKNETLEQARFRFSKLVKNSDESLDNVFISLFFIQALPPAIHINFTLLFKNKAINKWDETFEVIKQANMITQQQDKMHSSSSSYIREENRSVVEHSASSVAHLATSATTNKKKKHTNTKFCRYFKRGNCNKGLSCNFRHEKSSASQQVK